MLYKCALFTLCNIFTLTKEKYQNEFFSKQFSFSFGKIVLFNIFVQRKKSHNVITQRYRKHNFGMRDINNT